MIIVDVIFMSRGEFPLVIQMFLVSLAVISDSGTKGHQQQQYSNPLPTLDLKYPQLSTCM
jgi:hypothetical protein